MLKSALIIISLQLPAAAMEFRRFGSLELGTQVTSGALGAGIGYLFLHSSLASETTAGSAELSTAQAFTGICIGYTLGVLFAGKIFSGAGNPFLTLAGNLIPFLGPLLLYHLSAGNRLFTESLTLFNLSGNRLSFGLPLPYRRSGRFDLPGETTYYATLAAITF